MDAADGAESDLCEDERDNTITVPPNFAEWERHKQDSWAASLLGVADAGPLRVPKARYMRWKAPAPTLAPAHGTDVALMVIPVSRGRSIALARGTKFTRNDHTFMVLGIRDGYSSHGAQVVVERVGAVNSAHFVRVSDIKKAATTRRRVTARCRP